MTARVMAATAAVRELWMPLLAASLTTICAFLPIALAATGRLNSVFALLGAALPFFRRALSLLVSLPVYTGRPIFKVGFTPENNSGRNDAAYVRRRRQ